MSASFNQGKREKGKGKKKMPRLFFFLFTLAFCLPSVGCRQRMADQPYYRPLEEAEFFKDHCARVGCSRAARFTAGSTWNPTRS